MDKRFGPCEGTMPKRTQWIEVPTSEHLRECAAGDGIALKILLTAHKRVRDGYPIAWRESASQIASAIGFSPSDADREAILARDRKQPRSRRIVQAWKRLQSFDLVETGRSLGSTGIVLGTQSRPGPTLRMPDGYWNGWIGVLRGPASLFVLQLARPMSQGKARSPRSGFYFRLEHGRGVIGTSRPNFNEAVKDLEAHGLLHVVILDGERWGVFTDPELRGQPKDTVHIELKDKTRVYLTGTQFGAFSKNEVGMKRLPV